MYVEMLELMGMDLFLVYEMMSYRIFGELTVLCKIEPDNYMGLDTPRMDRPGSVYKETDYISLAKTEAS